MAVGHDEVILSTADAGRTWNRIHFAPGAQLPLLDVTCAPDGRDIAVGAYGVYFVSTDFGTSWKERKFEAQGARPAAGDDIGRDFHLNQIAAAAGTRVYVAAEAGHLYASDDRGDTWHALPSPYDGSFFGVKPISSDTVLAFGLRGKLFRSENAGQSWIALETGTHAMLTSAAVDPASHEIVVVGLSGAVLRSRDGGRTFALTQRSDRRGLQAALAAGGAIVTVGEGGVSRIPSIAGAAAR